MTTQNRASGLETIPELPWGTHLCQFYKTADDLLSVALPYIKAGMENNEYCLWVAWEPVDTARVLEAMAEQLPDPTTVFDSHQIEVASHCTPDFQRGPFHSGGLADPVKERIETVGKGGGLLLAPTHVLEPEVPWENLLAIKEAVEEFETEFKG